VPSCNVLLKVNSEPTFNMANMIWYQLKVNYSSIIHIATDAE